MSKFITFIKNCGIELKHILFCLSIGLLSLSSLAFAVNLELTQGINAAIPIGINSFGTDHYSNTITDVISNDLDFTGQFKRLSSGMQTQSLSYWQRIGVDSVLSGSVIPIGGMLEVRYELIDALAQGHILLSKKYQIQTTQLRALAHHISDEIYAKLTGVRGIFSTRIAYVLVRRSASSTQYSLEIADVDGNNPRSLLVSSEPIMSPTWSPDGKQIAYVSFEKKRAQIFSVQVATGQRRLLTDFSGINGAPAWSPDGRSMVVVLSKTGSPKLYQVNLSNGMMKQLTFGDAIDTEPRYAPDGQSLLFTSGRGGNPQIYRLSLYNGQITRLTFQGNYNARASYTPNQQQIVMLHREDQQFNIGVQTLNQAGVMPLTNSPMDESPSISPNGKFVLYATRYQDKGILSLTSIDGRMSHRFPARDGDIQEPAWSPYLG